MKYALLMLAALPMAAATDVSGKWTFDGEIAGYTLKVKCSLKQSAEAKIEGACSTNEGPEIKVLGEVKEEKVIFSYPVEHEGTEYTLTWSGKQEAETLKGDLEAAGAFGTFSGKKDAS